MYIYTHSYARIIVPKKHSQKIFYCMAKMLNKYLIFTISIIILNHMFSRWTYTKPCVNTKLVRNIVERSTGFIFLQCNWYDILPFGKLKPYIIKITIVLIEILRNEMDFFITFNNVV